MTDIADFAAVNKVYKTFFTEPYPARAAVQVVALPAGAGIEILATAMKD
ncbi:MAG: Rid family hydrolase [Planctomycetota bacterium]